MSVLPAPPIVFAGCEVDQFEGDVVLRSAAYGLQGLHRMAKAGQEGKCGLGIL